MKVDATNVSDPKKMTGNLAAGTYQFQIQEVSESPDATDIKLKVLAGTIPGQENKVMSVRHFNADNGSPPESLVKLVLLAELIQPGTAGEVNLQALCGFRFVAEVYHQEKDGAIYPRISDRGLAMWAENDPAAAAFKRVSDGSLHASASQRPVAQPAAAPAQKPVQTAAAAPAAAPAGNDPWNDIF